MFLPSGDFSTALPPRRGDAAAAIWRIPRPRVHPLHRRNLPRSQQDRLKADWVQRIRVLAVSPRWRRHFFKGPCSGEQLFSLISDKVWQAATILINCGAKADQDRRRLQLIHQITKRFLNGETIHRINFESRFPKNLESSYVGVKCAQCKSEAQKRLMQALLEGRSGGGGGAVFLFSV